MYLKLTKQSIHFIAAAFVLFFNVMKKTNRGIMLIGLMKQSNETHAFFKN